MCNSCTKVFFTYVLMLSLLISLTYLKSQLKFNNELKHLYDNEEMKPLHNKLSRRISNVCIAMFNIGYGNNQRFKNATDSLLSNVTTELLKAKRKFEQETENYLPFAKSLVKLVDTTNNEKLIFRNGTRLQIMNGKLPYVPCGIKDYSNEDFHKCIKVRKERNEPLWIAYFGDSKARNMLFYLLNNTHSFMNWTIDGNNTFTEEFYFPYAYSQIMKPINIDSQHGARLTLIISHYGTFSKGNRPPLAANVLLEWLKYTEARRLPDVLIVEFGMWYFKSNEIEDKKSQHEKLLYTWKQLRTVLKKLSRRITIICHISTRIRDSGIKRHVKIFKQAKTDQERILSDVMIKAATSYIDQVMLHGVRRSHMIFWDSTLPFNIASYLECKLLIKSNHSAVAEEAKLGSHKHLLPFMCNDVSHKSRATIHDETTQLLNLACNRFINYKADYCCS